ncbi:MAG: AI-2E family transporter [Lachnospiraceae bacterium]|nr:AI-2E family transporter [Lachnospiraceae bacterium]
MIRNREKAFLKGLFFIVLFYVVVEHFTLVKEILSSVYNAISPLIYGIVIAFIVNLIVVQLEKHMTKGIFENHTIKRTTSIVTSLFIVAGIIAVVCFNMIPGIIDSVKQIAEKVPQAIDKVLEFLQKNFGVSGEISNVAENFKLDEELVTNMFGLMENRSFIEAIKASGNVVGSVFSVFAKFFIGLFFAFYILAKKESIGAYIRKLMETYLPEKTAEGIVYFGSIIYETYANFISGQCLDAVILGCLLTVCMGIMGLPYPVLIGVIVAVTALIPVVGALFGGTVGAVLLVMDSPVKALTFLALFLILQQIDNRLIYPHIVGNAIGIPSILIFAAIVIGGEFGGVIGMFLGIPFTAVLYAIVEQDIDKRRKKKQEREAEAAKLRR